MRIVSLALLLATCLLVQATSAVAGENCSYEFLGEYSSEQAIPTFGPEAPHQVAPSRNFDVVHTLLDLDVEIENEYIAGSVTHTLAALRPEVSRIELHCLDMEVTAVSVTLEGGGSVPTSWTQYESLDEHQHSLIVELARPLPYGQQFDLRIEYHGHPTYGLFFIHEEGGDSGRRWEAWSQGEGENNRRWIPSFDYPNDKATYEGIFRVAKGRFALSNGVLVAERDLGDRTEFHWKLDTPQVNYLIALAAAEYEIVRDEWRGIPLMYLVPPGTGEETVQRCYGKTPAMLTFFEDTIGIDYPFKKYAQVVVQDFIVGGMENTTAVLMNERSLFDERAQLTRDADSLIAHEMAHMWWGDMVTMREWNDMWLNEGFATYFEKLWLEHDHGDDAFRLELYDVHNQVVGRDDREPLPMVVDFFNRTGGRSNANIYIKGGSVLHMLRKQLGDELFFRVIKHYGEQHKYDFAETGDLMRAVKEVTGENLDWFFEQWVYMAGHPKLEVSKKWDASTSSLVLTVKQTQKVDGLVPLFRLPVDVEVTTDNGVQLFSILVEKEQQDFHLSVDGEPRMVIFDKGDWLLKTLTFNKTRSEMLYQLEHGDAVSRLRALEGLDRYRNDADVMSAISDVVHSDAHYRLRRHAIGLYTSFPNDASVDLLLGAMAVDEARVRQVAAERATHARDRSNVVDALRDLVNNDPSYDVAASALNSLIALEGDKALDDCLATLGRESYRHELRLAALRGLDRLNAMDQLETIATYAGRGNSRWYRHSAISIYASLARRQESADARASSAELLEGMLGDSYFRTRESAIGALERLGEKRSVEVLREFALAEPLSWVAERARNAADRIEAQQPEARTTVEDLETQLEAIKRQLDELQRRVDDASRIEPEE